MYYSVARNLGYTIDYIPLYRDMSSRDLLQRRSTTPTGDTVWDVRFFYGSLYVFGNANIYRSRIPF